MSSSQEEENVIAAADNLSQDEKSDKSQLPVWLELRYLQPDLAASQLYSYLSSWLQGIAEIIWVKVTHLQKNINHTRAQVLLTGTRNLNRLQNMLQNKLMDKDIVMSGENSNFKTRYEIRPQYQEERSKFRLFLCDSLLFFADTVQFGNIVSGKKQARIIDAFWPGVELSGVIVEARSSKGFVLHVNLLAQQKRLSKKNYAGNIQQNNVIRNGARYLSGFQYSHGDSKAMEIRLSSLVGFAVLCRNAVLFQISHPPFLSDLRVKGNEIQQFFCPWQQLLQGFYDSDANDGINWQYVRIEDQISDDRVLGECFAFVCAFNKRQFELFIQYLQQEKLIGKNSHKLGEQTLLHQFDPFRVQRLKKKVFKLMQKLPCEVVYDLKVLLGSGRLSLEALSEECVSKDNCILTCILEDFKQDHKFEMDEDEDADNLRGNIRIVCEILQLMGARSQRISLPAKAYDDMYHQESLHTLSTSQKTHRSKWKYPIGKVIVTPTRLYPVSKQVEMTNRIVRDYFEYADRFIRVQFADENEEMLQGRIERGGTLHKRLLQIMRKGIWIGDKHFQWLHFSNSGQRQHSAWFFAPTKELTCEQIRSKMGDLANVRSIPKFAARMGQCFSTTVPTIVVLPGMQYSVLQDHESDLERHPYSDGCGLISMEIAEQIAQAHPALRGQIDVPCAYQIRYGGCKGMVCAWPQQHGMALRRSMMKFQSQHSMLEVCQYAQFMPTYLNRQIIILLSSQGVPAEVFLQFQDKEMSMLKQVTKNRSVALSVLTRYTDLGTSELSQCIIGLLQCAQMNDVLRIPFVRKQLEIMRSYYFNNMKQYARILVEDGVRLLGVVDELGVLESDEVFLQIQRQGHRRDQNTKIIQGKVLITRNPCLFPGDVRSASAVDKPQLRHLVNVLVFNRKQVGMLVDQDLQHVFQTKKKIPFQHMCSGGDLDGDDYFITWDQSLFPPSTDEIVPGLQYPDVSAAGEKDGPITPEDCQEHFVKYMISSNIGMICNAHLVIADQQLQNDSLQGAYYEDCVKLAIEAEKSFGFGKTGVIADLDVVEPITEYPHFMEKTDKQTYHSKSVLGQMYDQIVDCGDDVMKPNSEQEEGVFCDMDLVLDSDPMFQSFLLRAYELQSVYNLELQEIMGRYNVADEMEVWSGFAMKLGNKLDRHRDANTRGNLQEEMRTLVRSMRSQFEHMPNVLSELRVRISELKLVQASAWYCSVYHPHYRNRTSHNIQEGFAWIPYRYLIRLKQICPHSHLLSKIAIIYILRGQVKYHYPTKVQEVYDAICSNCIPLYTDEDSCRVIAEWQLHQLGIYMADDPKLKQARQGFAIHKDLWKSLHVARNTVVGLKIKTPEDFSYQNMYKIINTLNNK